MTSKVQVISFQSQFAPFIESGKKYQTIRKIRKKAIAIGDTLRLWENQRSKKRRFLGEVICKELKTITIDTKNECVYLNNSELTFIEVRQLAIADGFNCTASFYKFFRKNYGDRFEGVQISWY